MFKGFKKGPFKHTRTFFLKIFLNFFWTFIRRGIFYQFKFLPQKYACNKKKIVTTRYSKCSVTLRFCPMLVEMPYFGGVIISKNLLKSWIRLQFFFLGSLAYELFNFFFFLRFHENEWELHKKNIGQGLQWIYEFEVRFI